MSALQQAFLLFNLIAFAVFIVVLSAVSVRAACDEGPIMRKSFRPLARKTRR